MIELTPTAAGMLRSLRTSAPDRQILRVYVAGRSCSGVQYGLALDGSADDADTVAEREGISVAVDAASLPFVEGATVDYVETEQGSGFVVSNPSFQSDGCGGGGCSCGH